MYMPLKPIKHGIKVFCLCCSYSAMLLSFIIYVGKEHVKEKSTTEVVDKLILLSNLQTAKGRILYTDNYYTSIGLAKHIFACYGWLIVGTIVPTDKKDRNDDDPPFLKLSNGALDSIERGWYRESSLKVKAPGRRNFFIQCTTWKDKKQVMFLHTNMVGPSTIHTVRRGMKGRANRIMIRSPQVQEDYSSYFNAVDRNDRDSADYSISVRTNRYYLRIIFWILQQPIFCCYLIVKQCVKNNLWPEWKKYLSKNGGRRRFQIDLGISIIMGVAIS